MKKVLAKGPKKRKFTPRPKFGGDRKFSIKKLMTKVVVPCSEKITTALEGQGIEVDEDRFLKDLITLITIHGNGKEADITTVQEAKADSDEKVEASVYNPAADVLCLGYATYHNGDYKTAAKYAIQAFNMSGAAELMGALNDMNQHASYGDGMGKTGMRPTDPTNPEASDGSEEAFDEDESEEEPDPTEEEEVESTLKTEAASDDYSDEDFEEDLGGDDVEFSDDDFDFDEEMGPEEDSEDSEDSEESDEDFDFDDADQSDEEFFSDEEGEGEGESEEDAEEDMSEPDDDATDEMEESEDDYSDEEEATVAALINKFGVEASDEDSEDKDDDGEEVASKPSKLESKMNRSKPTVANIKKLALANKITLSGSAESHRAAKNVLKKIA